MTRTNDNSDLKFLDTVTNSNKFACTPNKTLHLNGTDTLFQFSHIGLIVPRFHVESDNRLHQNKTKEL